jgi:hypothetical protein
MWAWIYRIIAALLAFGGTALLAGASAAVQSQAQQLAVWMVQSFAIGIAVFAFVLLTSSILILLSPASRPDVPARSNSAK